MSLIEKAVQRLGQLKDAQQIPETAAREIDSDAPGRMQIGSSGDCQNRSEKAQSNEILRSKEVSIDVEELHKRGMVTPAYQKSQIAEEFRLIKRPILKNVSDLAQNNANLIMVTSSLPGEGKSFTAINLAVSIAMEMDHTVLLVDADVSKPSILKNLGLPAAPGLMDVLSENNIELSSFLLKTNIPKLSILPAGMPHASATEFLASEAMNRLLDEIATRYSDRIVIFDSPPLIATTEARVLASHMGQIVMVVEAGRTPSNALHQALNTIETCPIKMMVLNKSTGEKVGGYYGYGYGYGYGAATTEVGGNAA